MPQSGHPMVEAGDLGTALRVLTVLPVPPQGTPGRGLLSAWAWPLVGLLIGLGAAVVGTLLRRIGMDPGLVAAGMLLTLAALTGARHEAALLGAISSLFAARQEPEQSTTSETVAAQAQGSLALVLLMLARWSALTGLIAADHSLAPILGAAMLSRAALPLMMVAMPPAGGQSSPLRRDSLAPPRATAAIALIIGLSLSLFCLGWTLIPAVAAAGVVAVAVAGIGYLRIGGRTTELVGGTQPLVELGVLAALSAAL